jgi:N-acetylgalactosamine kinase
LLFSKLYLDAQTADLASFSLHSRAIHVYSEAARVLAFARACTETAGIPCVASAIGTMMTASHNSCRDDYECSHPKLDELVELSAKHGAVGAR